MAEVAQLHGVERPRALAQRFADQRNAERAGKRFREKRDDGGGEHRAQPETLKRAYLLRRLRCGRIEHDALAGKIDVRHGFLGEGDAHVRSAIRRAVFEDVAGAEIPHRDDLAEHRAVERFGAAAEQIDDVELVFRQARAGWRAARRARCRFMLSACSTRFHFGATTATPSFSSRQLFGFSSTLPSSP